MPAVLTGSIESSVGCTAGSSRENPEKNVDDAIRRHGDEFGATVTRQPMLSG